MKRPPERVVMTKVTKATIIQIAPLPLGWWQDELNRSPAIALVELEGSYPDGSTFSGREIMQLSTDLRLCFPSSWGDVVYEIQLFGDEAPFLEYHRSEDERLLS